MRKHRFQPQPKRRLPPTIQRMDELLQVAGIALNRDQLDRLWTYHNLIRDRNQDRDLTRIIDFESVILKHFVDSMIVGKFLTLPSPLLDIGTGAGFPGIPLKIRYPHLKMVLAEPRPRRVEFLKEAITLLELKHTQVFDHRVVSRSFQDSVGGVITRALEPIEKTVLRTSACLGEKGLLIFLKGPSVEPEIKVALKRFAGKIELRLNKTYRLANSDHERRLVVFEKMVPKELPKDGASSDEEEHQTHTESAFSE